MQEFLPSHLSPNMPAMLLLGIDKQKEGVMVRQDFLFMAILILTLIFFTHWGGTHHFRH